MYVEAWQPLMALDSWLNQSTSSSGLSLGQEHWYCVVFLSNDTWLLQCLFLITNYVANVILTCSWVESPSWREVLWVKTAILAQKQYSTMINTGQGLKWEIWFLNYTVLTIHVWASQYHGLVLDMLLYSH